MVITRENEKRLSRRYTPEKGTYVIFSPGFVKKGPVINISRTGLSCIYYVNDVVPTKTIDTYANISFKDFFLGNIRFKIISDYAIRKEPVLKFTRARKRTIQFESLSYSQFVQLDYFINHHAQHMFPYYLNKLKEKVYYYFKRP